MTRSRGPMPPPAPLPPVRRPNAEHGQGGQAEPTWPPLPNPSTPPHRGAVPDPRYAAASEPSDAAQYRYPEQQRGYDQGAVPRTNPPTLSQLAAGMRTTAAQPRGDERATYAPVDPGQSYQQDPPPAPRYGHQGHAAYAGPAAAPRQAARPTAPPLPPLPGRADDLRGPQYDDWQRQNDPSTYDLGNYGVPARGQPDPGYAPAPNEGRRPAWSPGGVEDPDYEPYQQRPTAGRPGQQHGAEQSNARDDDYPDDEQEDEEEEPRGGGRRWLIAAALIGSIGLGGGLAYGYKTYFADRPNGKAPVVKASQQPSKSVPENPGGKQFANQDSKVLGRLEQDSARGDVDANGVRRVQTIPFGRDGTMASAPVAPPSRPTVQVPGMVIDSAPSGGGPVLPNTQRVTPPPPPPAVETSSRTNIPPPPPPPAAARVTPPPPPPASTTRTAALPGNNTGEAAAPVAPKRPVVKPAEGGAAPKAVSGYVAVLTTRSTRMAALQSFADLQQKHSVLQDKIPDVIEADLSSRNLGTMYRLVVGPPGPRQQVTQLCAQLKAGGYSDCWATQY